MFQEGGIAYIYLCYGIHALFNIVTGPKDSPHACLVRAIEPTVGLAVMLERRAKAKITTNLTSGPGVLTQALGIYCTHNGVDLTKEQIWLEDQGVELSQKQIIASPRVGVSYAQEHAELPWRFRLAENNTKRS